ncbi:MAG: ABC transporter ATP-binding protein [Oscillospiraceae bacterium]|nr:ABC transporter ATP-binding protein [Oscillospiraceae bacterium]
MIEFKDVSKTYDDGFEAVQSLSFKIEPGELVVLIGPSGCGKTTTMKMINCLIPHTEGKIFIEGQDIDKLDPVILRRNIGYVIQQIGLFPHYTIAENVGLIPKLKKWDPQKIKARTNELMNMVNLDPSLYANRYPKELSGGQQQRVGVIRALAANPDIILMDEPFGALDPITRGQLQDELLRIQSTMQKTIVFVTHDIEEALKLGDRIAIMQKGHLLQMDTPDQILLNPAHGFVEEFVGKNRIYQNPALIPVVDIMKENVAVIRPEFSLSKALSLMRQRKTDTLVVVDKSNALLGILSAYGLHIKQDSANTVEKYMKPAKPVLDRSASAKDAFVQITQAPFGIIPVVDHSRKVLGIVTKGSLLSAFANQWTEEEEGEND